MYLWNLYKFLTLELVYASTLILVLNAFLDLVSFLVSNSAVCSYHYWFSMPYVRFLQLLSSSYSYPGMWLNTLPWYLSRLFYFVITLIFSALNGFCFSSIFLSVLLYRVWFSLQVIYAVCKVLSLLGAKTIFQYCVIYFLILSFVFYIITYITYYWYAYFDYHYLLPFYTLL